MIKRTSLAKFPSGEFIVLSVVGLTVFAMLFGVGVSVTGFSGWLLKQPDNLVTLIGSALVCAGLVFTALQWRADVQAKLDEARSRRTEQYVERIRQFRTPQTNAAIMMLLNYDRDVIIRDSVGPERVSWKDTEKALVPGCFRRYLYEPQMTAIRNCFNDMLEGMSRLHFLLTEELVRQEDVDHICRPLLKRLVLDAKFSEEPLARNLRLYILWRNPRGVMHLLQRYGLPIETMRDGDTAALRQDIADDVYGPCEDTGWGDLLAPATQQGSTLA